MQIRRLSPSSVVAWRCTVSPAPCEKKSDDHAVYVVVTVYRASPSLATTFLLVSLPGSSLYTHSVPSLVGKVSTRWLLCDQTPINGLVPAPWSAMRSRTIGSVVFTLVVVLSRMALSGLTMYAHSVFVPFGVRNAESVLSFCGVWTSRIPDSALFVMVTGSPLTVAVSFPSPASVAAMRYGVEVVSGMKNTLLLRSTCGICSGCGSPSSH